MKCQLLTSNLRSVNSSALDMAESESSESESNYMEFDEDEWAILVPVLGCGFLDLLRALPSNTSAYLRSLMEILSPHIPQEQSDQILRIIASIVSRNHHTLHKYISNPPPLDENELIQVLMRHYGSIGPKHYKVAERAVLEGWIKTNTLPKFKTNYLLSEKNQRDLYIDYQFGMKLNSTESLSRPLFNEMWDKLRVHADPHAHKDIYTCPHCRNWKTIENRYLALLRCKDSGSLSEEDLVKLEFPRIESEYFKILEHRNDKDIQRRLRNKTIDELKGDQLVIEYDYMAAEFTQVDKASVLAMVLVYRESPDKPYQLIYIDYCCKDPLSKVGIPFTQQCFLHLFGEIIPKHFPSVQFPFLFADSFVGDFHNRHMTSFWSVLSPVINKPIQVHFHCPYHGKGWADGQSHAWKQKITINIQMIYDGEQYDQNFCYELFNSVKNSNPIIVESTPEKIIIAGSARSIRGIGFKRNLSFFFSPTAPFRFCMARNALNVDSAIWYDIDPEESELGASFEVEDDEYKE